MKSCGSCGHGHSRGWPGARCARLHLVTSPAREGGYRAWIDGQIREAQERGEFDNLPGKGKPLKGIHDAPDEMWWVKQLLAREEVSYLPPALELRLQVDRFLDGLAKVPTERALRTGLDELNQRIRELNRKPVMDGPPSTLMPLVVEAVVARWHTARPPAPTPEEPTVVAPPRRRWRLRRS